MSEKEEPVASEESFENVGGQSAEESRLYKVSMCQFYLQGPCKSGESCSFAHGTNDLRSKQTGKSLSSLDLESLRSQGSLKLKMCVNFLSIGECSFGDLCRDAHFFREIQDTVTKATGGKVVEDKITLCRSYMEGRECEFGVKCRYAHGEHELRLAKHGKEMNCSIPYKSKICENHERGTCQYGINCHFAHSYEELVDISPVITSQKTMLCKNIESCKFGVQCRYAHSKLEIQKAMYAMKDMNNSSYGHSHHMSAGPAQMRMGARGSGQGHPMTSNGMDLPNPKKAMLCGSVKRGSPCGLGSACSYSHSTPELLASRQSDPRYKTVLCKDWIASTSHPKTCPRAQLCVFAHGDVEIRNFNSGNGPTSAPTTIRGDRYHGNGVAGSEVDGIADSEYVSAPQGYKSALCQAYADGQVCKHGTNCIFAHGISELTSISTYKKQMCKFVQRGGSISDCPRGNVCHYAHSAIELNYPYYDEQQPTRGDMGHGHHDEQPHRGMGHGHDVPPGEYDDNIDGYSVDTDLPLDYFSNTTSAAASSNNRNFGLEDGGGSRRRKFMEGDGGGRGPSPFSPSTSTSPGYSSFRGAQSFGFRPNVGYQRGGGASLRGSPFGSRGVIPAKRARF